MSRLINDDAINLKPYYQRNDIWTRNDQESLIDSIKKGFPLPSFFIVKNDQNIWEMVDGQQRARTIFRYFNKQITDSNKDLFNTELDFTNYNLSITELYDIKSKKEIENFYVLVNKKGKHLTTPELHKAEYSGTNFLGLTEDLLTYQQFMDLNLFTEASSKRMNDRNYVEELIAYLLYGIQDKKTIISKIYKSDISNDNVKELSSKFKLVIDRISNLNEKTPINKTRYKQKNDFYTLFNFIYNTLDEPLQTHLKQYQVLVTIAPFITPSNEDCPPFKNYAINCVSQSNSKKARSERLSLFNSILLNKHDDISENETLYSIANYIDLNELFKIEFEWVGKYYLIKTT